LYIKTTIDEIKEEKYNVTETNIKAGEGKMKIEKSYRVGVGLWLEYRE